MARILSYCATDLGPLCAAVSALVGQGGVTAIPTETYYGLGVNPFDPAALRRLASIKERPEGKPILVLIGACEQLDTLVAGRAAAAEILMKRFWPGPLTIVFPAQAGLPDNLTAGTGTIGVRWTSCVPLAELLRVTGPLTGTSANRSGGPPLRTAGEVDCALGSEIDLIVDAGATPGGPASTVVRIDGDTVWMVREGAVSYSVIERVAREQGFHLKPSQM